MNYASCFFDTKNPEEMNIQCLGYTQDPGLCRTLEKPQTLPSYREESRVDACFAGVDG